MEGGEGVEHDIALVKRHMRADLLDIGENIGMGKHHALGFAFGAGCEKNDRGLVGRGTSSDDARKKGADRGRALVEDRKTLPDILKIDELGGGFELGFQ